MIHPLTEDRIIIDADSRKISVPKQFAAAGVCGDTNAETVYIYCPRYFDDVDWYNKKCLIRFINAGNEYGEYIVTNMAIDAADPNMIIIGWTIQSPVTSYTGTVQFTLQFETVTNGNLLYQWQTMPAQMKILNGINSAAATGGSASTDTFAALSKRVSDLEDMIDTMNIAESMAIVNRFASAAAAMETRLKYLEDNVVYISDPDGTSPSGIAYSIVVKDVIGNVIDSFVMYYGGTHQIVICDSDGVAVSGITYTSDSPYVTVSSTGIVSVNYSKYMPTTVSATINTDYNPTGYSISIVNADGTSVKSLALSVGSSYKIALTDSNGNPVSTTGLTFSSDNPNVTVSSDGTVTVNYTSGMPMSVHATITINS